MEMTERNPYEPAAELVRQGGERALDAWGREVFVSAGPTDSR
jgi:hypothetical protein